MSGKRFQLESTDFVLLWNSNRRRGQKGFKVELRDSANAW